MASKSALLVIDMQEDFCPPNGSLAVQNGRSLAPIINELLAYQGFALKVGTRDLHPANHISFASNHAGAQPFVTEHKIPNPAGGPVGEVLQTLLWPDHCVEGTPGSALIPELRADLLTHTIDKGSDARVESYSAFGPPFRNPSVLMSGLKALLRDAGITDVFCVGLAYDYCVKATAVDAVEFGFRTFLVEEGSLAVDQGVEKMEETRRELREQGVVIVGLAGAELARLR